MRVHKSSDEDFSKLAPPARFGKLKWWFLLLILFGVLALGTVLFLQAEKTVDIYKQSGLNMLIVSTAYAQDSEESEPEIFTPRIIIISGIFVILATVYLAAIFKLFFTRNADQVDTAADLVKTLTGFFVGAGTGFLG